MTNEFLKAAQNSEDTSEERYQKLKEEQAGTEMTKAEKRYEELKEKAKRDFVKEQKKKEEKDDKEESSESNFVTY